MSSTSITKPHFFKPLIPGFEDDFLIPVAFSKYLKEQKCEKAMLGSRKGGGKLWPVNINGRRFEDGWKEFVEDHEFQVGDFLVFRHEGDLVFYVLVFDRSTCEREYPCFDDDANEGVKTEVDQEEKLPEGSTSGQGLEEKHEVKTSSEPKPSSFVFEYPYTVVQLNPNSIKKSRLHIPRKFARDHGLCGRCCSVILKNEEGKCWPANLLYKSSTGKTYIAGGWTSFRVARMLKAGDSLIIELTRNGKIPVLKIRRKELEEKKNMETRLVENDSSSALDHPYCKIKLSPESLRKSRLYIPRDFARLCGLYGRSCSMVLEDEEENCWPAKLLYKTNDGKFIIGDGWGDFHSFHKLKAGDTLMIELIKLGETPVMKICRVRELLEVTRELKFQNNAELGSSLLRQIHANTEASELRKSQPKTPELAKESCSSKIISGIGKSCSDDSGKSKKYKDSGAKANSSSVIQKDFFVAKVTDFTCKSSKLYIPVKFARLHFENKKCCKVILIDQEGRSFTAYSWHKSFAEEAYITDGWKEFSDANNLKIGDSFVFEFIGNEERPVLQMRGFKAANNQEAASSSKEKPYIYVTLQASHARMGQLKLPVNFARTCDLAKCSAVTIKNEMGNSWIVALRLDKHNEVYMTHGWPEFVKENGMEAGDVFKLELVKEGIKPEIKYYALKQEMGSNQKEACEDFNDVSFWRC